MHPYQTPSGWCGDPSRGASMGRTSDLPTDTEATLHLRRVPLDSGGYDPGGAYWGTPCDLYIAEAIEGGEGVRYLRAGSIEAARAEFPRAKFGEPDEAPGAGDLADMVGGYLTAALFTSTEDDPDGNGASLDANYHTGNFAADTRAELAERVKAFALENAPTLRACMAKGNDWAEAGRDLWFTSNGHGVGFWEVPDWPEAEGKILTEAAHKFGEVNLYVDGEEIKAE